VSIHTIISSLCATVLLAGPVIAVGDEVQETENESTPSDFGAGAATPETHSKSEPGAPDVRANSSSPRYQIDSRALVGASLVRVLRDARALDFAVKAKIYPEDPDSMFVTLRGGGISVYDVSARDAPRLRSRWDTAADVEGQDRLGDLLVVVARSGALLTFDVSDPDRVRHLATVELATDPGLVGTVIAKVMEFFAGGPFRALHTKLYHASDGRLYALVTATASGELIAVDVTDPKRPVQVGALQTGVQFIEGIYVHREHAFVGGFGYSEIYLAIDVSNPRKMSVVRSLSDATYRQMVSEMNPDHPDLLYVALWNDFGGLAVFDVADPADFRPLGSLVRSDLARSNRVKLHGNLAFLPLEQEPGGFAVVDVTDPTSPGIVSLVRGIRGISTPYTLAVNRDHLYVFGSEEAAMAVFRLERGEPELAFARWNFGTGDDEALVGGRAADRGHGLLRYLDADTSGKRATRSQTTAGVDRGIGYLEFRPAGDWKPHNGLALDHGLAHTHYGRLPGYTLVWDVSVPGDGFETNGCFWENLAACNDIPLYQLDRTNREDARLFLKVGATPQSRHGFVGKAGDSNGGSGLEGYAEGIQPDTWHRIALVVDLARKEAGASIYLDGDLVREVTRIDYEKFASVAEGDPGASVPVRNGFLLLADNDGEMGAPVRIGGLLFVNRAYDADEVASLGPPGSQGIPPPREEGLIRDAPRAR
jgi:hypothetical protein